MARGTRYKHEDYHRTNEKGELEKKCTRHNEFFPSESEWLPCTNEYYHINEKNKSDGLHPYCKKCAVAKLYKKSDIPKPFNKYEIKGEETIIFLERRDGTILECIIDTEDLKKVNTYHWTADIHKTRKDLTFAFCNDIKKRIHQLIIECNPDNGEFIDHIDGDGLNNHKINLRVITNKGNLTNLTRTNKNNKSGYRNVCWNSWEGKWMVQLQINGVNTRLGFFDDVNKAGLYAEEMRNKYYNPLIEKETFFTAI